MQPPPQTPPSNLPPTNPPQLVPPGTPPKKPNIGLMVVALGAIGGIIGFGAIRALPKAAEKVLPSGISSNGQSLSRADAREGMKEIGELARGARAGDPSSINAGFEPKTQLGKDFKALAQKSAGVEKTFADALGGKAIGDLIAPERLTSKSGRDQSDADLKKFRTASKVYFADTKEVSNDLFKLIAGANGQKFDGAADLEKELAGNERALTDLMDRAEGIVALANRAKPTMQGAMPVFTKSSDVTAFNKLIDGYNDAAQEFERASAAALQARQARMQRGLSTLDKL